MHSAPYSPGPLSSRPLRRSDVLRRSQLLSRLFGGFSPESACPIRRKPVAWGNCGRNISPVRRVTPSAQANACEMPSIFYWPDGQTRTGKKTGASDAPHPQWHCRMARGKSTILPVVVRGPAGQSHLGTGLRRPRSALSYMQRTCRFMRATSLSAWRALARDLIFQRLRIDFRRDIIFLCPCSKLPVSRGGP